jgi:hypothetical protein
MYQPHRVTLLVQQATEESLFVRKLIVLRAIQDVLSSNDRQTVGAGPGE